ncbi:MAG: 16S rRNA (guanine(527)-N(7))-methyltransferase RsmG [Bacilli bacterium]|nr:16S rRNA (guanine(527)-N(7))-methyltransferase RsmG [Bacilli bacterium]
MNKEEFIKRVKEDLNITLTKEMLTKLDFYAAFLIEYNKHTNLTALKTLEEIYLKHFYDSLTLIKTINLSSINTLCDVGTGAGFPGLVLKIVFYNLNVTLIDSNNKKIKFLEELVKKLELNGASVINMRSEDYAKENKEKFDVVTARAVTTLPVLIELCLPLVKENGYFIPLKGNAEDEINISKNILGILNGAIEDIYKFVLPEENSTRTIIKIKKNSKTPEGYPRSYDKIKKSLKKYLK